MDPAPIPEDRQRPAEIGLQASQEGDGIFAPGVGVVGQEAEADVGPAPLRADGDAADRRDPPLAMPSLDERRAAPRGVGAADRRRELEARLVEEDQVGPRPPSLLEDAGELLGPSAGGPPLIPLPGLPLWPLAASAQPPSEDLSDVFDVVPDAEAATD